MMQRLIAATLLILFCSNSASAQRDAPVWDSYLPRIEMYNERTTLDFELTWLKGGGPKEQALNAQMYVLIYLEKDEEEILKLAQKKEHTNKENKVEDLLLAVLEEKKLAKVVETKLASQDRARAETKLKKKLRGGSTHDFEFSFENKDLLTHLKGLANFDEKAVKDYSGNQLLDDKFKLLIFIPVNDCKLANLIPEQLPDSYDFAHFMDTETFAHYLKPLPYEFQLNQMKDGDVIRYNE